MPVTTIGGRYYYSLYLANEAILQKLGCGQKKKKSDFCICNIWTSKELTQAAVTTVLSHSLVFADSLTLDLRDGEKFSCHLIM